jgi:small basic protein
VTDPSRAWAVCLGSLAISAALDWLFARWTRALVADRRAEAVLVSGLYYALQSACTVMFVAEPRAIPFVVVGHALGTYAAMPRSKVAVEAEA